MPPATATRSRPAQTEASRNCNMECEAQLEAARIVAASNLAIATSIDRAVEVFTPAADAISHLSEAQKKLCGFLVKHRLKLAASIPAVFTAIGALSPTAAKMLQNVLVALPYHP